ncbi:hypothetical protein CYMTET_10020 [Cymbomonas tetramitiformis]|uniref:Uncharacterized protein n=1 Tax=Cymbomonas tetramitiformis TaxID=36881 RepID=A0AAE0GPW3_9CHLO|nr:hypothetical protein CYMTET_10020 [Cymbomonas tetramitiformis]
MVHFGSATPSVIDDAVVEHEPEVAIETEEDALIYPKQFVDGEPPFEQSFMDSMSVKLGFFEPEPQPTEALPALFLCVSIAMIDTVTATALCDVEIAPRSVVYGACSGYQNGTVDYFPDPDLLDTGPADFYNIFSLDSDGFGIYSLNFKFEYYNNFNLCELYSVDHFQGG